MSRWSSVIRTTALLGAGVMVGALLTQLPVEAAKKKNTCKGVKVGKVCVDRYEASVWSKPDGGIQYGVTTNVDDYPCNDDGQDCAGKIFARSVKGVQPSAYITWFQAQAALANVGKRLPTNAEWQQAAMGTPDPGSNADAPGCRTSGDLPDGSPVPTGSRADCRSTKGAYDMVGNLWEWVADWVPASTAACPGWGDVGTFSSDDEMCLSDAPGTVTGPGALQRGGGYRSGAAAGVFAVAGFNRPSNSLDVMGFRGAR